MTRRMLINAQAPEEVRVAIVSNSTLQDFQVETTEKGLTRGNVYRGVITNIQPSLNAAFVDFGEGKHGFLPFHDVVEQAYSHPAPHKRPRVQEVLEKGKPIVVQVTKDPEGQKGAALTTNVSLAGRYLVLTPFDSTRGVSRKVEDEDERAKLREQVSALKVPDGGGFIVRTNALGQTRTELKRDFTAVSRVWKRIQTESKKGTGPKLLHEDQDVIVRAIRDTLDETIEEILVDDEAAFEKTSHYVASFLPKSSVRVTLYTERVPLFSKFELEPQIDRIYDRSVPLKSGGSIVIDRTEALVAIDVNSGKSTRAATQAQTALQTNLEAAAEIARQLRLRDIGGLIVVDFIDMRTRNDRATLEKAIRDHLKVDKARTTVGSISANGLLEINRQKIRQALVLRTHRPCPTCNGSGRIASPEFVGLNLLRRIAARAAKGTLDHVRIELHPELADSIQNGRRADIAKLESEFGVHVEVISSNRLHRPEQEIEWHDREVVREQEPKPASHPHVPSPAKAEAKEATSPQPQAPARKGRRRRKGKDHHPQIPAPAVQDLPPFDEDVEMEEPEDDNFESISSDTQPAGEETGESGAEELHGNAKRRRRQRWRRRRRERELAARHAHIPAITGLTDTDPSSRDDRPEARPVETEETPRQQTAGAEGSENSPAKHRRPRRRSRRAAPEASAKASSESADTSHPAPQPDFAPAPAAEAMESRSEEPVSEAAPEPRARRPRRRSRRAAPKTGNAEVPAPDGSGGEETES